MRGEDQQPVSVLEEKSDEVCAQLTEASEFIFAKGSNGDFANAAAKTLKK